MLITFIQLNMYECKIPLLFLALKTKTIRSVIYFIKASLIQ